MASKLDKSIKDQIEPQYKLLGSAEKVGKQLNIAPSTVVRHLKKLGYDFSMYQKHSLISYEEGLQKFPQEGLSLAKFCSNYQLSAAHFGRFLRKTSMDELPQLFNVLFGSMSLVGPRPEVPHYVRQFKEDVPLYLVRQQIRPGMTGWAQIHGLRGDTSIEARVKYDLWYIENWSLWLDIKILFKTVFGGMINNEKIN